MIQRLGIKIFKYFYGINCKVLHFQWKIAEKKVLLFSIWQLFHTKDKQHSFEECQFFILT